MLKQLFLLISILFTVLLVHSQNTSTIENDTIINIDSLTFNLTDSNITNLSLNVLGNDQVLKGFFKQLYQLKTKNNNLISIVHIGDSHIQADYLTGTVRIALQKQFGNAGRGLVFPYKVARTNSPLSINSYSPSKWEVNKNVIKTQTSPIGISGISIKTTDSLSEIFIELLNQESLDYSFNRIKVFMEKNEFTFDLKLFDKYNTFLNTISSKDLTISPFLSETILDKKINSIRIKCFANDICTKSSLIYGFEFQSDTIGLLYNSIGVNGAAYCHYLYDNFFLQLPALAPNLIIVSLGTNDGFTVGFRADEFETNLNLFIQKLKNTLPNTAVILCTPPDCFRNKNVRIRNMQVVRNIVVRKCIENGFAYWDLYNIMGGYGSMQNWFLKGLAAKDKVHFKQKGYEIQGKLLYNAILKSYGRYGEN